MAAAAAMEHNGTPIDVETLARLREGWTGIQDQLIAAIDRDYGVYDGRTFKLDRFAAWLAAEGIPWPRLESGQLDLSDDDLPPAGQSLPAGVGLARASQQLGRSAAQRSGGREGRT